MVSSSTLAKTAATGVGIGASLVALDSKYHLTADLQTFKTLLPLLKAAKSLGENSSVLTLLADTVAKYPDRTALIFTENGWSCTYKEFDNLTDHVAHTLTQSEQWKNVGEKGVVALLMENRPEYLIFEIALVKAGATPSLINSNNKAKPLVHSILSSNAKLIICGNECKVNLDPCLDPNTPNNLSNLSNQVLFVDTIDTYFSYRGLNVEEARVKSIPKLPTTNIWTPNDTYVYIFTSGTTGLPKACIMTHSKVLMMNVLYATAFRVNHADPKERYYCALPLYHTAGGAMSFGNCLAGTTLVLARKFSASKYIAECAQYECTISQYIGELARYLLASPPNAADKSNKLRLFVGNGLRQEIWMSFVNRFGLSEIGEFYGSTEGNVGFNHFWHVSHGPDGVGAVGRTGALYKLATKFQIVKHDVENEVPVRDNQGLCIPVADGEVGELLGLIEDEPSSPFGKFKGYLNKDATEKKILRDVKVKGDRYFRTGDLLKIDSKGYVRFVDRIGDTFRWKGENVSTNEVSEVVSVFPNVLEANVYGVKVPGNLDGKACMACIVKADAHQEFDLTKFAAHVNASLASYARPLFLRFENEMRSTGTMKQQKNQFVKEGIDKNLVKSTIYWYNRNSNAYEELTDEVRRGVETATAKL